MESGRLKKGLVMCPSDKETFIGIEGRIDEGRFVESGFSNALIQDGLSIYTPIHRYTNLFTLLQILSGSFLVNLKEGFSDKSEKGETFRITCYDFCIAGESFTNEQLEKSQMLRTYVKETLYLLASCWTKEKREDCLMWKSYASEVSGIRISSTIKSLLESIDTTEYKVYIGEVRYKDLLKVPISDVTNGLFEKPIYYKGEDEIRFNFAPLKGAGGYTLILSFR